MTQRGNGEGATLRDVARLAGVSLGTASQALNKRNNVAPETRAKVLEAAAALGYQHQTRVTVSNPQPLSVIGMILKQDGVMPMAANPFYSYVLSGVERECQRMNLSLMFASVEVDELNCPVSFPPMLLDQKVDGILVVGTFIEDTILEISQRVDMPIVLIDAYAPGKSFDSVIADNLNGAYAAVEYLIKQGHRNIGLIGSLPDAYPSIRERRKGYLRALKYHGIETSYIEDGQLNRIPAYDATCRLLRRAPEVTAIFACNDECAIGVMNAAREMGREIPSDLSVVGFDDIDLAQEVTPALTTVHVDKVLMGVLAVRHLRDRAESLNRPALTTALSTQLIVRDSVLPPKR
ncbi:MAG: LacI family DNA-binding transcriptional regulator [Anaerolineae bacterium]|nr:LacI family DNA-binding transcriptional regulator [Anaerolineae bacterium]